MRKWIMVIFGTILVIGSCFGFVQYMKGYELDVTMMNTIKPVKMIQAGELITESMIRTIPIATVQHMDNAMLDRTQIIGKRAIVPIGENEEFLAWKIGVDKLYPTGDEEYIGFKIDFVGTVNNMIRRGDKVDVWVEYTKPKLVDATGAEIDEGEQARQTAVSKDPVQGIKKIYNKRLISNLTVAYVKDQEGKEITDVASTSQLTFPGSSIQQDEKNAERYRQNASGLPSYITFIMTPEQYMSFAEGAKDGIIRLGLPATSVTIGTIISNKQSDNNDQPKQNATAAASSMTKASEITITPDAVPALSSIAPTSSPDINALAIATNSGPTNIKSIDGGTAK